MFFSLGIGYPAQAGINVGKGRTRTHIGQTWIDIELVDGVGKELLLEFPAHVYKLLHLGAAHARKIENTEIGDSH